jgi:hypothetical protein
MPLFLYLATWDLGEELGDDDLEHLVADGGEHLVVVLESEGVKMVGRWSSSWRRSCVAMTGSGDGWRRCVTPGFRRQTECEPCTCQDQLFTYTAVT